MASEMSVSCPICGAAVSVQDSDICETVVCPSCSESFLLRPQFGPYRIERRIGKGGMGTVFLARQVDSGESCALKLLSSEYVDDEEHMLRFRREIETLSRFRHPNIVRILPSWPQEFSRFYAMEYVEGQSVAEIIAENGPIHWKQVIDFGIQICRGLKNAHDHGIVHRDLKPGNLLVDATGVLKIADFGIAKPWFSETGTLTQTGTFVGTADYMSPEQAQGESASNASDIYSLGAVMYAMLTGRPPFQASSFLKLCQRVIHDPVVPPSECNWQVPVSLEEFVCQLLEKDDEMRPTSAYGVQKNLEWMIKEFERKGPTFRDPAKMSSGPSAVSSKPFATTLITAHDTEPSTKASPLVDDARTRDHLTTRESDDGLVATISRWYYVAIALIGGALRIPYVLIPVLLLLIYGFFAYLDAEFYSVVPMGERSRLTDPAATGAADKSGTKHPVTSSTSRLTAQGIDGTEVAHREEAVSTHNQETVSNLEREGSKPIDSHDVTFRPGDFVVSEFSGQFAGTSRILGIEKSSGAQAEIASAGHLKAPRHLAVDDSGDILVVDRDADPFRAGGDTGAILRVSCVTGGQTVVSAGGNLVDPVGIVIESDGTVLIAEATGFGGHGGIIRVDHATGAQNVVSKGGNLVNPHGLALDQEGRLFIADANAEGGTGAIIQIDPVTGDQNIISAGQFFQYPRDVAVEADGNLLVVDSEALGGSGAIIRVDPETGQQIVLSSAAFFENPTSLVILADGSIIVVDADGGGGSGGVVHVDPKTGSQTVISKGGRFHDPYGIAVLAQGNTSE
jgi:serine/threonine protein kinase